MSEDTSKITCEAFQAQLPELVGSHENLAENAHLKSCELCRALLADLETIAEAARQLFPIEEPPDELWEQIESKIKKESKTGKESADEDEDPDGSE
jgi:predicted anti-sigma-YlaC factor YlaD